MSFTYRLGRSFLPSPISAAVCAVVGLALVGVYLIILSVSLGTSLPALFDGEWGIAYTNNIVQPLLSLFSNLTVNKVLFLGAWGFAGLLTYFLLEYLLKLLRDARSAEHDIQFTPYGIVRHPGMNSFLGSVLWRAGVLTVFLPVLIVAVQPPLHKLGSLAPQAVLGNLSGARTIGHLLLLAMEFGVVGHIIVVLLRLLTGRMRLFSDDPM